MQNQALIIAGMHRSGTSLITNWLSRCGLQIGECLAGSDVGNIDGHFEDMEFLKAHEEILKNNGLHASGLASDKVIKLSAYHLARLQSIINIKQQLYGQWGWKDPRTCLFLDTYAQLLPDAKYLVIIRDYQLVLKSLIERQFTFIDKKYMSRKYLSKLAWVHFRRERRRKEFYAEHADYFLKVWINYNEEILKTLKRLSAGDYLVINYSLLLKQDAEVIRFLKNEWKFELDYSSFKAIYKEGLMSSGTDDIDAFVVDKSLLIKAGYLQIRLQHYMKD